MVTGCKPGIPSGPDLYKGKPSSFTGPRTEWPTKPCGELPLLLSQRIREPDLLGHVVAPRPSTPGQSHAGDPGRALQGRHAS